MFLRKTAHSDKQEPKGKYNSTASHNESKSSDNFAIECFFILFYGFLISINAVIAVYVNRKLQQNIKIYEAKKYNQQRYNGTVGCFCTNGLWRKRRLRVQQLPCNLAIDNSVHLDATLASSMNALSPGIFTTIKPLYKDGTSYFYFKNNQGMESEKRFNAIDENLQSHLRIGMNKGL